MQLYPYILLPLFLSSCLQTDPKPSGDIPVSVRSVNYNADRGVTFSIYDVGSEADPQCGGLLVFAQIGRKKKMAEILLI